jgi:hypothetical protein
MSDTEVINPGDPVRMLPKETEDWRQQTPLSSGGPLSREDQTPGTTAQIKGMEKLQEDEAAEQQRYQARLFRERADLQRIQGQRPKIPTQQQLGPPPDAREYQKHTMAWAGSMAMIGALFAKGGRMSGQQAMDAFSGAMKGWHEGNLEAYTNAANKWKETNQQTLENNRQLLEKYQMVMDDHRLNIDQQKDRMLQTAVEHRDTLMYNAIKRGDMATMGQLMDNRYKVNESHEAKSQFFKDQVEIGENEMRLMAQHWAPYVGPNFENLDQDRQLSNHTKEQIKYAVQNFSPQATSASLTPLSLQEMVDRRLQGDKSVTNNIGRGTQGGQNLAAYNNALSAEMQRRGITGEQLAKIDQEFIARQRGMSAEEGAVGQRAGAIALAVQEADDTVPNVRRLAELSAGRGYATWDAVASKWKMEKGDKNFATYVQQLNTLVNIYGRFISGGGRGAVTDREHARDMLNPNMPLSAIEGSLDGFEAEIGIGEEAPSKVRARMRGGGAAQPRDTTLPRGAAPAGGGRGNLPAGATPTSGDTIPPGWKVE